jgi:hypothetical protein
MSVAGLGLHPIRDRLVANNGKIEMRPVCSVLVDRFLDVA